MASQRAAYGRFLFLGVGEGVGFGFSSVEFQSNQHLSHSFIKKKKKKKKYFYYTFFIFHDSVCRHLGV